MTNKEWMATLTAEQFWDVMMWLIKEYGRQFTHTQLAVISWLDSEHKPKEELGYFITPHIDEKETL